MGDYIHFRVVDTKTNTIYSADADKGIRFLLDQNGNILKKYKNDDVIILQNVDDHKPLLSLGIFDKNNKEIFDGDILLEHCKNKDGAISPYYYVAKYNNETLAYGLVDYTNYFMFINDFSDLTPDSISFNYEVVGNIYENNIEEYWEIDKKWKEESDD